MERHAITDVYGRRGLKEGRDNDWGTKGILVERVAKSVSLPDWFLETIQASMHMNI